MVSKGSNEQLDCSYLVTFNAIALQDTRNSKSSALKTMDQGNSHADQREQKEISPSEIKDLQLAQRGGTCLRQ